MLPQNFLVVPPLAYPSHFSLISCFYYLFFDQCQQLPNWSLWVKFCLLKLILNIYLYKMQIWFYQSTDLNSWVAIHTYRSSLKFFSMTFCTLSMSLGSFIMMLIQNLYSITVKLYIIVCIHLCFSSCFLCLDQGSANHSHGSNLDHGLFFIQALS